VLILDVSERLVITDLFVLASAPPTRRQVRAVVDEIGERLRAFGAKPVRAKASVRHGGCSRLHRRVAHVMHVEEGSSTR